MERWSFSINNDKLIELVLTGKKTATTSIYQKKDLPVIGEETIIQCSNGVDACIVKTIDYKVIKFCEITEDLARLEGEGDLSLEYWKKVHYDFFKSYNPDFNKECLIMFEIFEVNKKLI